MAIDCAGASPDPAASRREPGCGCGYRGFRTAIPRFGGARAGGTCPRRSGGCIPPADPAPPASAALIYAGDRLAIIGDDPLGQRLLADALAASGVAVAPTGALPRALPRLLVLTDYLGRSAEELMIAAEADAVVWMPLKLAGARACFGPTLGPGLPGSRAGLLAALRLGVPSSSGSRRTPDDPSAQPPADAADRRESAGCGTRGAAG